MKPVEEISLEEYRAKYEKRQKRGRATRPDIPAAGRQERTGLSSLILRGWCVQSPDAVRYRLWHPDWGLDTTLCSSLRCACDTAKGLEQRFSGDAARAAAKGE